MLQLQVIYADMQSVHATHDQTQLNECIDKQYLYSNACTMCIIDFHGHLYRKTVGGPDNYKMYMHVSVVLDLPSSKQFAWWSEWKAQMQVCVARYHQCIVCVVCTGNTVTVLQLFMIQLTHVMEF